MLEKIKLPALIVLTASASFGLGRLSNLPPQEPIKIESFDMTQDKPVAAVAAQPVPEEGGQYVGSKSGTKYHYPWCSGAVRIKDENKIWFNSVADAKAAGYTPAANCPGLE